MSRVIQYMFILFLVSCSNSDKSGSQNGSSDNSARKGPGPVAQGYEKADLKKIKWIEGKWRGMYNGAPFYEIYELINDSTLQITSFEWNGKDSSKTSKDFVAWQGNSYYLGHEKNYKVTAITDSQILMVPNNKASNSVLWKYRTDSSWDAILEARNGTQQYLMERFDPFTKTPKKS